MVKTPCPMRVTCDAPVYVLCVFLTSANPQYHFRLKSLWTMEEWLAFVETFSPLVVHALPWEDDEIKAVFEHQWKHLRTSCLYFLRYREGQHTDEQLFVAADAALEYAASAEKVSTRHLNMHR